MVMNIPSTIKCPSHTYSYGVTYSWIGVSTRKPLPFSFQTNRVFQESDGTLYFARFTKDDIAAINQTKGMQCKMDALQFGSRFSTSVLLKENVGE